ncbi:hypothetical protein Kpol_505p32 [Vanderwaltozyma polyspora DSM 70294]|uniref:Splicing factor subunit n=1 Tax=Vanderwaltozyma polyspora (strain ATCC 22028 / DSM 70294 / BCRC 21397 / CBS 2163 / NBRC 10782 / NRRL Y-8283 / UCD 57-17) TaxID=436907 RepID=A7TNC3_VANPO|nr:uncharacterized protein Kpol_505p32 [Vanderwaltozyma polyspora DSM 70294]EDO16255.1 hypothetical protein Kpol_505p32 [Vanderwaltozyma polyspora DSM 70294]
MSDKVRQQQLYQVLKQKYVGLGNEKTTKEEWLTNVNRDTYNSLQGHSASLEYITLGKRASSKRDTKVDLINKMCNDEKIRRNDGDNK